MTDYSIFVTVPDEVYLNTLYTAGQLAGLRAGVFTKIGDSISFWQSFMGPLGFTRSLAVWGEHQHLEDTANYFRETVARRYNSFADPSVAALRGGRTTHILGTYTNFNATYRYYTSICTGKTTLECAYDELEPAYSVIMLGTNDMTSGDVASFQSSLQDIVDLTTARNIIPLLTTIPRRLDGTYNQAGFNAAIADVATNSNIPLIDLYSAMESIPSYGIGPDNVHPSWPTDGNTCDFTENGLQYGWNVRNITTLEALRIVRDIVTN